MAADHDGCLVGGAGVPLGRAMLEHVSLGRGFVLAAPALDPPNPWIARLHGEVVSPLEVFGVTDPPGVEQVQRACADVLGQAPGGQPQAVEVRAVVTSPLGSPDVSWQVDIAVVPARPSVGEVRLATATHELGADSPLAGRPLVASAHVRASASRAGADDVLLIDDDGLVVDCGRGSLVVHDGSAWSWVRHPRLTRPNLVLEHSGCAHRPPVDRRDLVDPAVALCRVSARGEIDTVTEWDGVRRTHRPEAVDSLRAHLS